MRITVQLPDDLIQHPNPAREAPRSAGHWRLSLRRPGPIPRQSVARAFAPDFSKTIL